VIFAEELVAARRAGLPADDVVHGSGGERLVVGHARSGAHVEVQTSGIAGGAVGGANVKGVAFAIGENDD
jgi:hypothetical protein